MSCSPCSSSATSPLPSLTLNIPSQSSHDQKFDKATMDYMEKRKKNNDAARKSREVRRLREQASKLRTEELEEENQHLRDQLNLLRLEYSQLMILLFTKSVSPLNSECSTK